MVIVFASSSDLGARALVETWPQREAKLLTPAALARPGWVWDFHDPRAGTFVLDAERLATRDVAGIVALSGGIHATEVVGVHAADAEYAAAEAHAFLLAWLHALPCPRLNPPSLQSLNGELDPLVWQAHALAIGLPAAERRRPIDSSYGVPSHFEGTDVFVTCIGDEVIGSDDERALGPARELARATRLPMLTVALRPSAAGYAFVHAAVRPNCFDARVRESIARYVTERKVAA